MKFAASNGITFMWAEDGSWRWEAGNAPARITKALRELFLHERDEKLGRWRYPDDRDYVVYPVGSGTVVHVLNEKVGVSGTYGRAEVSRVFGGEFLETADPVYSRAARAYFEVHPKRKPWEDAKEGEVWIITPSKAATLGEKVEYPAIFQADRFRDHGGSWDASDITAARRIWPESS